MAAQEVLTGIQIHRNGRYPYDYEQVHSSYSDVLENIESDDFKKYSYKLIDKDEEVERLTVKYLKNKNSK